MKNKYYIYYTFLGLILLSQVLYTIYQTSFLVVNSRRQKILENRRQELLSKEQDLQTQLALENSLLVFRQTKDFESYQLIDQPLLLKPTLRLAAVK